MNNNSGRKYRELQRLCAKGPVLVWLVADGARWSLRADLVKAGTVLSPAGVPAWSDLALPTC